ncbi:MAG TPA: response regulator [Tepidisphaeraceae bacterium]|nr:response regulator [Tepidisphaeraceae bacterium]
MPDERIPRVLVVDDNPATRYSTSRILKAAGFTVFEAGTGEEGIDIAKTGTDAVVLDVNLPDINGFEVCRRLRANSATARIPVIHLSATFVKDIDKVTGLEAGADGYLTHPVEPPVLIATVNAFLRARAAEDQREKLLISERSARQEAERANRLKDEFLATLSHELRTPLNAIVGWSQLLRRGPVAPEELAEGLEAIERNAKAQTQLIADLLDVSRITSGKLRLDIQPIDPAAMIDSALDSIKHAAAAKNIHIARILDAPAFSIFGDPGRLQQVMWNLVTNAVKFTPKGGKITVTLQRVNSHVEIAVRDTGDGISPELLPHIFERFQQGDASTTRRHGGLGLGLAIVKNLIEMHGGTIAASSDGTGKGSAFVIKLPLATVSPLGDVSSQRVHPAADMKFAANSPAANLAGLKVLVVDDDIDGRTLLRRVLADSGADVSDAKSAEEALEKLATFAPQILVSDIGMPVADGYDFIKEVRERGFAAQTLPAIALTAFARTEDRRRAMLAGYQVHLAKPVDPSELIAAVAMLGGRTG